jgi:hypothetical protein
MEEEENSESGHENETVRKKSIRKNSSMKLPII